MKKRTSWLLFSFLFLVMLLTSACSRQAKIQTTSPEELSLKQTLIFFQLQTNQARILQTQGGKQPENQNTPKVPTIGLTDVQLTPTQLPLVSATSMPEISNTPPRYPSTEQLTPTQAISNTSIISTRTSTPTNTRTLESSATNTPTSQPSKTSTPTQMKTNTLTFTSTHTPSPTLQTGWGGEWIAYLAQSDGSYRSGDLIVTISGNSVAAVFDNGGVTMNLEGSFQTDESFVSGDYTLPSSNGFFKWRIEENSYLIGNIDNEFAFCAAREGLPQPDPCGYFDPN